MVNCPLVSVSLYLILRPLHFLLVGLCFFIICTRLILFFFVKLNTQYELYMWITISLSNLNFYHALSLSYIILRDRQAFHYCICSRRTTHKGVFDFNCYGGVYSALFCPDKSYLYRILYLYLYVYIFHVYFHLQLTFVTNYFRCHCLHTGMPVNIANSFSIMNNCI